MQRCNELAQLIQWWQTPMGELLFQAELAQLEKHLDRLFGYKLLLIAPDCFESLSTHSRMGQVLRIDPCAPVPGVLPTHIDAIIIPHLLSYSEALANNIKNCWQSLEADGQLIITGYRSFSYLAGARLLQSTLREQVPAAKNSQVKIKRCLQDNSFQIMKQETFSEKPSNSLFALFASGYVISARKEVVLAKINESLKWQKKRKLSPQMATSGCRREQN